MIDFFMKNIAKSNLVFAGLDAGVVAFSPLPKVKWFDT